jgi:hypothetical protein
MARPEPTASEVAQKRFETLCQLLVKDAAYETLRSRLYEKVNSGSISDKYSENDRAAIDLGSLLIVPTFFKMIEDGAIQKPEPPNKDRNEY